VLPTRAIQQALRGGGIRSGKRGSKLFLVDVKFAS